MSKIRVIRMPEQTWEPFVGGLLGLKTFAESTTGKAFLSLGHEIGDAIEMVRDAPLEECDHPNPQAVSSPRDGETEYFCDVCGDYYLVDDQPANGGDQ